MTFTKSDQKSCFEQLLSLGNVSHSINKIKLCLCKVKESRKHVRIESDIATGRILGSCVMDSGQLLLADYNNKKRKQYDTNKNTMTNYCMMQYLPFSVCILSDVEAAVRLENKLIEFVSISNGQLLPTRILNMDHCCNGLAFAVDKMYITDDYNLYV